MTAKTAEKKPTDADRIDELLARIERLEEAMAHGGVKARAMYRK